jgi:hypothetical protein
MVSWRQIDPVVQQILTLVQYYTSTFAAIRLGMSTFVIQRLEVEVICLLLLLCYSPVHILVHNGHLINVCG